MFNNATEVVLMRQGARTVLAMQNHYQGRREAREPPLGITRGWTSERLRVRSVTAVRVGRRSAEARTPPAPAAP
jgi:hypothetical protein